MLNCKSNVHNEVVPASTIAYDSNMLTAGWALAEGRALGGTEEARYKIQKEVRKRATF